MNKKGVIAGGIAAAVVIAIIAAFVSQPNVESVNLDMERTHGEISTAMGSPILGNPDAEITIVEFGDYQCPNCYRWFQTTKPQIVENYIETGKANLIFMDLPFLGRDSPKAAEATYCAEDQGRYWSYHDLLYNSQQGIDSGWADTERLKAFAFSLDFDIELFNICLDSGKYSKRVQHNLSEARDAGADATPTFFIIDNSDGTSQKITGAQPYSVFKNVIDSMI